MVHERADQPEHGEPADGQRRGDELAARRAVVDDVLHRLERVLRVVDARVGAAARAVYAVEDRRRAHVADALVEDRDGHDAAEDEPDVHHRDVQRSRQRFRGHDVAVAEREARHDREVHALRERAVEHRRRVERGARDRDVREVHREEHLHAPERRLELVHEPLALVVRRVQPAERASDDVQRGRAHALPEAGRALVAVPVEVHVLRAREQRDVHQARGDVQRAHQDQHVRPERQQHVRADAERQRERVQQQDPPQVRRRVPGAVVAPGVRDADHAPEVAEQPERTRAVQQDRQPQRGRGPIVRRHLGAGRDEELEQVELWRALHRPRSREAVGARSEAMRATSNAGTGSVEAWPALRKTGEPPAASRIPRASASQIVANFSRCRVTPAVDPGRGPWGRPRAFAAADAWRAQRGFGAERSLMHRARPPHAGDTCLPAHARPSRSPCFRRTGAGRARARAPRRFGPRVTGVRARVDAPCTGL